MIEAWRREQSLRRTSLNRPDLLKKVPLSDEERQLYAEERAAAVERVDVYIALVHYPVLDPKGNVIATSVTNLDIHDIARLSRTYNVKGYYIVQPGEEQKELTKQLLNYWTSGHGSKINPDRREALSLVSVVDTLDDVVSRIEEIQGEAPLKVATTAKIRRDIVSYEELKEIMIRENHSCLLVFGTGYGLTDELMEEMNYVLKPIVGRGDYNHLSVRSAVSIILDRLLGE